jgi:RNA polymerase sigma-70 factor (ECF subfamily)
MTDSVESEALVRLAAEGDNGAWGELLTRYRERLTRMAQLRLDRRLHGRLDASDIVQEATLEAARRLPEFIQSPPMGFYLWLRQLTGQKLIDAHRRHLGAQRRDAQQEISLYRGTMPAATSLALANQLLGRFTSPTQAAERAELQWKVEQALNSLDAVDREVLVLRHFEQLSNEETAQVLGIGRSAASKRFLMALKRLKEILRQVPGLEERMG